jgi:sialidase-1
MTAEPGPVKFRLFALLALALSWSAFAAPEPPAGLSKLQDIVIYSNPVFYCSFPSVVRRADGELIVAFRRAPDRRRLGEPHVTHTDANSYLVLVRSRDDGQTWTREPELMLAHPFGGSQDPCMVQLRDGSILCTSYGWALITPDYAKTVTNISHLGNFGFLGGFLIRSDNDGRSWQGPIVPCPVPGNPMRDIFGKPVPSYNRGALCEGNDGRLFWVVAATAPDLPRRSETHLLISTNQGQSWDWSCPVARDPKIEFNETSLYQTPKGDLVAFLRTEKLDDHTVLARSANNGRGFEQWQDLGFQGHPHYALRLPDDRVLLVYGYRHAPYGVRARILDPECRQTAAAKEFVLRDDGGSGDLGYPWAVALPGSRVLVVYYFNKAEGNRFIAGTVLKVS